MAHALQLLIGVDKKNPLFTIFRDVEKKQIHIYYGGILYEVINDDKNNPEYKLMLARLHNSGVRIKSLIENFGYCYKTIKRWGEALKCNDPQKLLRALSGQGAPKKITEEILAFVAYDFEQVYSKNKSSYSSTIRDHIQQIYGITLSSEALRPTFNKLKEAYNRKKGKKKKKLSLHP